MNGSEEASDRFSEEVHQEVTEEMEILSDDKEGEDVSEVDGEYEEGEHYE